MLLGLMIMNLCFQCDLMDGRDAFLTMAREKHFEFSSLRRCKYSTLVLIYELHTQVGSSLRFVAVWIRHIRCGSSQLFLRIMIKLDDKN